ncbi:MAG TPA: PIG-L family deacetylase [Opitutaceae bacterium]|nr:PIG-L family deacetylase [Opitutaceae bacterium]
MTPAVLPAGRTRAARRGLLLAVGGAGLAAALAAAPAPEAGTAILQDLRGFRETGRVLYVAAHPDDENTQLIAWLSRGRALRTAYLSLTRGDGGQNELGPEFDEKLGVIRTEELLAARGVDGGRQFFSRAIDFGFSKTPEESLAIWDHQQVLADVVRVIRTFRPDVVITRFPIPPGSGGHGHHTASAILAVEAFKLAGDAKAFPDQIREGLAPWQPRRILWNSFNFGGGPLPLSGPTIKEDAGGDDPVTGEALGTIANRSRGMHKTQGLGGFSNRPGDGPRPETFLLLGGDAPTADLMDGIDTTWARFPGGAEIGKAADDVIAHFNRQDPAASVPALLALRARLAPLLPDDPVVNEKRRVLDRILAACLGLKVETTIADAEVVPGELMALHHTAVVGSATPVRWLAVRYPVVAAAAGTPVDLTAGQPAARDATERLPAGTAVSQPYWLREPGTPGMFRVDDPSLIGRPEDPPAFPVEFVFEVGGQTLVVPDEPVQLATRPDGSEVRRRLEVIPPVSLEFASDVELFAPGAARPVVVEATAARANAAGTLRLDVPAGWQVEPAEQAARFARVGERNRYAFTVTAPAQPERAVIGASIEVGGARYDTGRYAIDYAHIPPILLQPATRLKAVSLELAVRAKHVGYLPGAGDSVADALKQMGCEVTALTGADLTPEKLRGLDAVVIGVRAFNVRSDLADHVAGLFAWVEAGGTVVEQYNRPGRELKTTELGPYPLSIEGPAPRLRVTDENAPVTFLAPDHPVLNTPNRITVADFAGWAQERGTYFPSSWDEAHYTAVLAMSDPGEPPLKSSLLVAADGRGWFVYTGLVFFRELPDGVPGAYRLFANLISLGK